MRSGLNLVVLPVGGGSTTNHASTFLALHTASHADVGVKDESPDGVDPTLMARQVVVELGSQVSNGMQASPGNGGEVMVLVVEADVVREPVERAVVGEGLGNGDAVIRVLLRGGDGFVDVVLSDKVASQGVKATSKEGRQEEVEVSVEGGEVDEGGVEGELDSNVQEVDLGQGNAVHGHGAEGVEEDLEGAEEGLSKNGVEEEGFKGGRKISIEAIDAEGLVVGKMVGSEGSAIGDANGKIGEDGDQTVGHRVPEGQVMGDFVDGEEEVLVSGGTEDITDSPELPRPKGRRLEEASEDDLEGDDAEDDPFGQWFGTAELRDLRVSLDDGQSTSSVRLLGVSPEEVVRLVVVGCVKLLAIRLGGDG